METTSELRSLDRFLTTRGAALAGITGDARRIRIMGIMGSIYGIIGAVEAGVGVALAANGNPVPVLLFQGGIFLLTGGLLAGIRQGFKHRAEQQQFVPVEVTPEAKALLQTLLSHLHGMPFTPVRRRRRYRRLMEQEIAALPDDARSSEKLRPETFALLEHAAQEANRIYGMLEQAEGTPDSALKQMAPSIAAAADEAMAAIFHVAAQIDKFPESSASVQAQTQQQIAELHDLADQVERLCALSETPSSTRLQTVLQTLRADLQAREELNTTPTVLPVSSSVPQAVAPPVTPSPTQPTYTTKTEQSEPDVQTVRIGSA